ncbi:MAG: hypothetical protein ACPG62_10695 [Cycloclasticus sp.]
MTEQTLKNSTNTLSWKSYYELCKPKVVMLIVFTAIVGMFLLKRLIYIFFNGMISCLRS